MAFSLSNWFKSKSSTTEAEPETEIPTPAAVAAPVHPSVRTVTPNQQQAPVSLREPTVRQPVALTATKLPVSGKVTPVLPASRKVSFAPGTAVTATPSEAAPAPATPAPAFVPPAPDVTVSLEIGDFLDRLPTNFVRSGSFDRSRKVEFQASELYSDLSKGRASVPASVIYERCPELFSRPVTETEDVEVPLPLRKLVEQMGTALSTRHDQVEEENVGEIETPFLQVAMEDNARLPTAAGSTIGAVRPVAPLKPAASGPSDSEAATEPAEGIAPTRPHRTGQISTISPVKASSAELPPLAPPTAATASPIIAGKRPPSTVRASVAGGKIRLSGPAAVTRIAPITPEAPAAKPSTHSQRITLPIQPPTGPAASPSHQVTKKTARIQIPPISLRTGGPNAVPKPGVVSAPPTAPTMGNPPVPTGKTTPSIRPGAGKEGAPTISFRTSPPPPSAKPIPATFAPPRAPAFPPPAFPAAAPATPATAAVTPPVADDRKIELGLAAVLRTLASAMLSVEPSAVPDDVRLTLPFALIEPQLSQGRVSVGRETFLQALPESHRGVLSADADLTEVPLPLQEVFQNLPASALSIRGDQMAAETGNHYPTPFSQKADEDAARLGTPKASPDTETPVSEVKADETPVEELAFVADAEENAPTNALPEPSIEASPAENPTRDVPLDPEPSAVEDKASATSDPVEEKAADAPVKSRDIDLGTIQEETPAPETPAVAPEPVPTPAAEPVVALAPPVPVAEIPAKELPAAAKPKAVTVPVRSTANDGVLQTLFMTEEEMDAKTIVKLVCQLPAVNGCAVMFEDGLRLAGNFPSGNTEGFSAMAAPFYKRAVRFVSELELGTLQAFTLNTENGLLSFFMHDNICVSVHHAGRGFMPGVREKLEVVTRELARMYATAKPADTEPSA